MMVGSAERLKNFLGAQSIPDFIVFGQHTIPKSFEMLLSHRPFGVNVLHILNVLNNFTLGCSILSDLVEVVIFALVKVNNFCKYEMVPVYFKLLMEKTQEMLF